MADHTEEADRSGPPDYDLPDSLEFTSPEQYRALFEDTRLQIISALNERAATTSELAAVLGKPKGTIGHHLKVLAEAGLVHVVRTKKVRALEAKYYGRTARVFYYHRVNEGAGAAERSISTAAAEIAQVPTGRASEVLGYMHYARIADDRAEEFGRRLTDLLMEFTDEPRAGDTTYGMAIALYPTNRRALTDVEEAADAKKADAQQAEREQAEAENDDGGRHR